jgi:hypothetical protein
MPIALVFTGHMTDAHGRDDARFPPSLEGAARTAIGAELDRLRARGIAGGFASAARGGDIVFHEECRTRGIATTIVLPFAPEQFVETSVEGAGDGDWIRRFQALWVQTPAPARVIRDLPVSAQAVAACNARLLDLARRQVRYLIALWDGKAGMVGRHRRHGRAGNRRWRPATYHRAAGPVRFGRCKALERWHKRPMGAC